MADQARIGPLPPARRKRPPRQAPTRRPRARRPPLHLEDVLAWADAHYRRTGRWPNQTSGEVVEAPWEKWPNIDQSLRAGTRGCRGGSSLPRLLHSYRGVPLPTPRPRRPRPKLTDEEILGWADAFHQRTGDWPSQHTPGVVAKGRLDTWRAVDLAMRKGIRGLPGGDSLAQLLIRARGVLRARYLPNLTIKQILAWADAYHARTGNWPTFYSGKVEEAPDETWPAIHAALERGGRGLRLGYTLATLLAKYRGKRYKKGLPDYTPAQILEWADAYFDRHGRWPTLYSGRVAGQPGETWRMVEGSLSKGRRGLPGGSSLSQLLMEHGRRPPHDWKRHGIKRDPLTIEQILAWADEFYKKKSRWPAVLSGPIPGTNHETWQSVDNALRTGVRGLPGGSSLALLLEEYGRKRHKHASRSRLK